MLVEVQLKEWEQVHEVARALPLYIFRGQSDSNWGLSSSLERSREGFLKPGENSEHWMLHEFKKRYRLYESDGPDYSNGFLPCSTMAALRG